MTDTARPSRQLFVTDFDGALTRNDFFRLVIEAFAPEGMAANWEGYRAGRLTHFEALRGIFGGIRASEAQLLALLDRAGPPPNLAFWFEALHASGWEVVVASAGCAWYIERILASCGVAAPVHANPGQFLEGQGLRMELPTGSPYYSSSTGIDKAAIVRAGQQAGRVVAFAGDGYPDVAAALLVPAGLRFARADLALALRRKRESFVPFECWTEVARALLSTR